jgi:ribulose-5-phosphate 4-epimerase/fuculose-1-phosphate aldolase
MSKSLRDDGIIKYHAIHKNSSPPDHINLDQLDEVRTKLFDLGLVGVYSDGIGYGNVSIRNDTGCIISGTSTGAVRVLGASGYCYVRSFDLNKNTVKTEGPILASSESMTHCAIYQAHSSVQCVLHIHNRELWQKLLAQGCDATLAEIAYGTPQMAVSMATLVIANNEISNLLVMAGHEEGIVAYGDTINSAFDQIQAVLDS